jgi:hypothetical protein
MSDITFDTFDSGSTRYMRVKATGGSRRERGSKIGALIRSAPGKWERYHISYSETDGFLSATYANYRCDSIPSFEAHTGRPSWHQARAGAISSGIVSFGTKKEADEYVERYKTSHPGEPAFVITKD